MWIKKLKFGKAHLATHFQILTKGPQIRNDLLFLIMISHGIPVQWASSKMIWGILVYVSLGLKTN